MSMGMLRNAKNLCEFGICLLTELSDSEAQTLGQKQISKAASA